MAIREYNVWAVVTARLPIRPTIVELEITPLSLVSSPSANLNIPNDLSTQCPNGAAQVDLARLITLLRLVAVGLRQLSWRWIPVTEGPLIWELVEIRLLLESPPLSFVDSSIHQPGPLVADEIPSSSPLLLLLVQVFLRTK
jgi:hypothetical protein